MVIDHRDIDFVCENGRIRCSPTRVRVKGYTVVLEGTMGLDQTLDYRARVPITPELVGREVYAYLEGTTLSIPIRGTASHPELNLRSLQEGLADLAAQAARKALEQKAGALLEKLLREQ
jgi:translocation and assembly module TamB